MSIKVLISGGGTGGHIFPAIAIANAIKLAEPGAEFLFVGAIGKMEMEKVPAAGYKIVGLPITGIQRKLSVSNLLFPFRLLKSLLMARSTIKSFQPNAVVGVGGFASGPVLRMATWMKVPTLIQEQNSFAGITNRWVAPSVSLACVAYDGMGKFFPKDRIIKTGNPVRKEMVMIQGKRDAAIAKYGFDPSKPIVLIVGGSLGARSINLALKDQLDDLLQAGIQVLWQTGKHFTEHVPKLLEKYQGMPVVILDFIFEMDLAYAAADVVVSRAGAIAVSELSIVGKPCILVPFPFAAEDHQTKNAEALVTTNAAEMIPDRLVNEKLKDAIIELVSNTQRRQELTKNIANHAKPDAADHIANLVLKLAKG